MGRDGGTAKEGDQKPRMALDIGLVTEKGPGRSPAWKPAGDGRAVQDDLWRAEGVLLVKRQKLVQTI